MTAKSDSDLKPSAEVKLEKIVKRKNKKIRNLYILIIIILLLFIGVGVFGFFKYSSLKDENRKLSNPEESVKLETNRLINQISKLVDVPNDEQPTIATVTDIDKLKDQTFFAKAENGDKLLVYNNAKKAILFRPSTSKIIEIGPLSTDTKNPDKQDGVKATDSTTSGNQTTTTPTQ